MKQIYGQIFQFLGIIGLSGICVIINYYYPSYYLQKIILSLIVLAVLVGVFRLILPVLVGHRISDPKSRYSLRKIFNITTAVLFLIFMVLIWIEESTSLLVTSSIIGAGIAFALQDVFKSFVGGLILLLSETYRIGDRIEIDDHIGDVIDIGIMNTVIMEIRGWVHGDQVSGRLISIPNASVINRPVINYTRDHSFIWDELSLPLTYDSNWQLAIATIEQIIRDKVHSLMPLAEKEMLTLGEKYYLVKRAIEPSVYISLTDNWIQVDARYICDVKNRRQMKHEISFEVMNWIASRSDVDISSTTSTITIRGEKKVEPPGHNHFS
ncbi:MAG: mechanosensitive ion channel domain-containing protein [Methanobacteriota archaeon]